MSKKPSMSSFLNDTTKAMYQPWREEAFRADEFVQTMTPIQKWMFRTLLQAAFVCAERPYLPDDDARLWAMAGCESPAQWKQHKDVVRARFVPITLNKQRLLSHKRVIEDWNRIQEARETRIRSASTAGKASAAKRWGSGVSETTQSQPSDNGTLTEVNSPSTANNQEKGREVKPTNLPTELTWVGKSVGGRFSFDDDDTPPAVDKGGPALAQTRAAGTASPVRAPSGHGGKSNPAGKENLFGWKLDFQRKVQRIAAQNETGEGTGIVFAIPLPDKVFQFVEQFGETCGGLENAQQMVLDWLVSRSFAGLQNPNAVWDKMPDEVYGFGPDENV